jgi:2-oxoglutarate ferredoxin oxidoreductase subunit gamma
MHEEVIMAGTGGQGIMRMGQLLTFAAMREEYNVVWFPSYGPEARGGTADCTVIVSSDEIGSPISSNPDTLIGMHERLFTKFQPTVKPGGKLLVNTSLIEEEGLRTDCQILLVPANTAAEEMGFVQGANMVMMGAYAEFTGVVTLESLIACLVEILPSHRHKFIPINEKALRVGAELARSAITE